MAVLMLAAASGSGGEAKASARAEPKSGAKQDAAPISSAVDLARKWGVVTSVKRSLERNRAVGGMPNSFHLYGRAIDIARRPGVRHADIDSAYRKAGYRLIESLDEGDHSHFAFGIAGAEPRPVLADSKQLASSSEAAAPACVAAAASPLIRRRPDRSDGCPEAPSPAPRLRPLEPVS